ncbi:SPFH domain-containing protein [Streptomyces sp. NPDC059851]|uniref:SPFH domain-containing protein n=1 Tax=Streptomyces sp. NPDC059851 TaxID=3346971 RepID=UPI00365E10E6
MTASAERPATDRAGAVDAPGSPYGDPHRPGAEASAAAASPLAAGPAVVSAGRARPYVGVPVVTGADGPADPGRDTGPAPVRPGAEGSAAVAAGTAGPARPQGGVPGRAAAGQRTADAGGAATGEHAPATAPPGAAGAVAVGRIGRVAVTVASGAGHADPAGYRFSPGGEVPGAAHPAGATSVVGTPGPGAAAPGPAAATGPTGQDAAAAAAGVGPVPPADRVAEPVAPRAQAEAPVAAGRGGWVVGVPAPLVAVSYAEVPAARAGAAAGPPHAPAGVADRAEQGAQGGPAGQDPDTLVCVPAPASPDAGHPTPAPASPDAGHPTPAHAVADGGTGPAGAEFPPHPNGEPGRGEPVQGSGPGPRPAAGDVVAQAVARGMPDGTGPEDDGDGTEDPPRRGVAVTDVPVRLPFPPVAVGTSRSAAGRGTPPANTPTARRGAARPAPGRRVPRGDDRLREHHGPVLPGWVGVAVGGLALAGCLAVFWRAGALPAVFEAALGASPRPYAGLRPTLWPPLALLGVVALLALGGLGRGKTGHAWVLTLFGRYRGTVRRTGLTWVSPLLLRRRVDVRLRHWRSDPMPAVDAGGLALQVVVQVVWQVKDTARAVLAVEDHTEYLAQQVESAMARVLSQLPADAFHEDAPTLRDAEAVGDALTRMLAAETEAVGIEVYSAQPTRIEYAPEVAEAMRRRRVAAIDAKHRDAVLTSIVDAVDDTVHQLTSRGLVELDDYERKALVKDLTVAFYTGRSE